MLSRIKLHTDSCQPNTRMDSHSLKFQFILQIPIPIKTLYEPHVPKKYKVYVKKLCIWIVVLMDFKDLIQVTQLSPSTLKSEGIPVYRCVQHPKQFVLIFPGAYCSGLNTGFNVSVRVNVAPFDWLVYGQRSVEIYSELHRKTLISYDKLLIDACRDTAKASWLLKLKRDSKEWRIACGTDGWLTRALKSRVKWEQLRRDVLCNASQSHTMDSNFCSATKQECIVCNYDLYLSATSCSCSPNMYTCLQHSKQLCSCPWSSRIFLFRYTIVELNSLIDALQGKLNALYRWAKENRELFFINRDGK